MHGAKHEDCILEIFKMCMTVVCLGTKIMGGWPTPRTGRFMSGKEARYQLHRDGLDRSGKYGPTPELDPPTVHTVASRNPN